MVSAPTADHPALNDFLPGGATRRAFSLTDEAGARCAAQLATARALIRDIEPAVAG